MRPKTSDIWQYFRAINSDFAQCKICGNKYSRKGRTTTSLRAHLKAMHKEIYEENGNLDQSGNLILKQPHSITTPLQIAEKELSLAETWHKQKYKELCKLKEQQDLGIRLEQSRSDTITTLQEPYTQQFLEDYANNANSEAINIIQVKEENVDLEHQYLETCPMTSEQKRISLEESSENNEMPNTSHPTAKNMDDIIGEMIALQNLPFHFVEGIGFRRVMEAALPDYQLRGSEFFTNYVCNEMYSKVGSRVRIMLKKCLKLSFTMDIWSVPNQNTSILNLTAHGVSEDFSRVRTVLKSCSLQVQSGDKICENIKMMLRDWGIPDKRLHCFIRDGSNTVKAMHLTNAPSLSCPIHQLELCIRSVLKTREVNDLIVKCREIANSFDNPQTAQDEQAKIQRQFNKRIFLVAQELLDIKESITSYASKYNKPQILPDELRLLNKIIAILNPIKEIAMILGDSKTGISSVIPLFYALKHTLQIEKEKADSNHNFKNIIENLVEDINSRFGDIVSNTLYSLATYLDPRYKLKFFNQIIKEQVQSQLLCLLAKHNVENERCLTDINDCLPSPPKKPRGGSCLLNEPCTSSMNIHIQSVYLNLADILNSSDDEQDPDDSSVDNKKLIQWRLLSNEYNEEKRLCLDEDPLSWWKYNSKYKDLAPVVRNYLSLPASSVCQQLSKEEGIIESIIHEPNNHITEKVLFVKYNLPLINFDY